MFKDYQVFSMSEKNTYKLQKTEQSDFFKGQKTRLTKT